MLDLSEIFTEVLLRMWWALPTILIIILVKTAWFKGVVGEFLIRFVSRLALPKTTYHAIHNVTLPTSDGTTQIDHVIVSRYGIFVVETKNMKGWIFGGERQAKWTQKIFKKSFQFQNPLRQNHKHVKALEAALDVPPEVIHSVIVFTGEAKFKTTMPANVTRGIGYISFLRTFREPVLSESTVSAVVQRIQSGRLEPSRATNRQHVQNLKAESVQSEQPKCPGCGSTMVLRTAKRGANRGNQFWGCSAYPSCRKVQPV